MEEIKPTAMQTSSSSAAPSDIDRGLLRLVSEPAVGAHAGTSCVHLAMVIGALILGAWVQIGTKIIASDFTSRPLQTSCVTRLACVEAVFLELCHSAVWKLFQPPSLSSRVKEDTMFHLAFLLVTTV